MSWAKVGNFVWNRWSFLILILAIAVLQYLVTSAGSQTKLQDMYHVATIWGIIYTALIASRDYFTAAKIKKEIRDEEIKYKKIEHAIALCDYFDNDHLLLARDITRNLRDTNSSEDVNNIIKYDENKKRSVINMFNYWERIGLQIEYKMADEGYLKRNLSDVFISQYERFQSWHGPYFTNFNPKGKITVDTLYQRWKENN